MKYQAIWKPPVRCFSVVRPALYPVRDGSDATRGPARLPRHLTRWASLMAAEKVDHRVMRRPRGIIG
jgi:hypothetical protein